MSRISNSFRILLINSRHEVGLGASATNSTGGFRYELNRRVPATNSTGVFRTAFLEGGFVGNTPMGNFVEL